ncbi:copper chaperone PCu(A)C [Streptomyces sp. M19]
MEAAAVRAALPRRRLRSHAGGAHRLDGHRLGREPGRPEVAEARLLLPSNPDATAAFFRLRNRGGADDALVRVTSPATGRAMLSRRVVRAGAGSMRMVSSAALPAHGTLRMSASGLDVMVQDPPPLRAGDRVPFVLHFRDSAPLRVMARVVRPGG